ncbi:GMP synthase [Niabella ginsenosidivorans]|uniref:GMP synthase n=1 Tax=Niabella ginsenosidivorans TaxID=1176587 RepID=A0A1A9I2D9_9BACT|nr:GMP synthase [Niabella ginsenosidivorans]ANH81828.1 GMP synthase [Niabella ginsenosidivorans]
MVNSKECVRFAILDMNEGHSNQGMRCIKDIVHRWANEKRVELIYDVFEVRLKNELPDMTYDIYISSGGPGDPLSSRFDDWDIQWNKWLNETLRWNENPGNDRKKFVFFICHSFQLASRYFNAGLICKRKSTSFGVFPVHLLPEGRVNVIFKDLNDPFYAVDSRDFQLIQPNLDLLGEIGAYITCIEKERPHVPYERAVMGISFNPYMFGTQFHPEADAEGMLKHFQSEEKRKTVIDNHGAAKLNSMIDQLKDPDKIMWTNQHLLPNFLNEAHEHIMEVNAVA